MANNWSSVYLSRLHSVYDKQSQPLLDLVSALCTVFVESQETLSQLQEQLTVTKGTEDTLDGFGEDYAVQRLPSETDESYRARIKEAKLGRGVTRPRIRSAINRILGAGNECSIIKWNEASGLLPIFTFAIDLPVYDVEGFYLDDEGDDGEEDGAYLDIGTYVFSWVNLAELWPIQQIIDTVTLLKTNASEFQIWSGDHVYNLEAVNGSS